MYNENLINRSSSTEVKTYFGGWSPVPRLAGGTLALLAAVVISLPAYHKLALVVDGWGVLGAAAFAIHAAAVIVWYFRLPRAERGLRALTPALDAFVPFLVFCVVTAALLFDSLANTRYLPGLWMAGYGVVNLAMSRTAPAGIRIAGIFYIACGSAMLLYQPVPFTNPWPMGLVFFAGEWFAGCTLLFHGITRRAQVKSAVA